MRRNRGRTCYVATIRDLSEIELAIDELTRGMILQVEVRSNAGGLLVSRGQEITPTVIFKLRNFHSRGAIAGELTVSMPKTTLSFVKGASQGKS